MLTNSISLFIVDSDELSRTCFCLLFDKDERLSVVGSGTNLDDCIVDLNSNNVDVLVVKVNDNPGGLSAILESLERIKASCNAVRILVLLETISAPVVCDLVRSYVTGICSTRISVADLLMAVRSVAGGCMWFAAPVTEAVRNLAMVARGAGTADETHPRLPTTSFTERENEILGLIAGGLSNAQIASRLQLSIETVKTYVRRIMDKSSIRSRRELLNSLDQPIKGFPPDKGNVPNS